MSSNQIEVGDAQAVYNAAHTRVLRYTVEIFHNGLKEHKLISAPDIDMLNNKANLQINKWAEKWSAIEAKRLVAEHKEANIAEAASRTEAAARALKLIDELLVHTLSIDDTIDWSRLKKRETFKEKEPEKPTMQKLAENPPKPRKVSPTITFIDRYFLKSRKERKIKDAEAKYAAAGNAWEKLKQNIADSNQRIYDDYNNKKLKKWEADVLAWEKRVDAFMKAQAAFNGKIDSLQESYMSHNPDSVVEYCDMVLNNSRYPDAFPQSFELEYNPETKILIVEYEFPSIECLPNVKEVRYVAARKELAEVYLPEAHMNKIYDDAIYKITLRTIHELFEADTANAIDAVSFNGWVNAINKATGKEENNCIVSIQVKKSGFMEIDLSKIEPRTCFKSLKGVASSKLASITPIQPILQIEKADKRFVQGIDVADTLDSATNLAAMDWEDFEHLIRELFEKEFQANGGEVKITQASRDGGVDAVAFDPDPIRGGKIVIQAKRYTNTVSVSAVRELYGTVVNEGATKGILVSTADYGPDAYEFAKGKPLTLLNGSNLLHLLEKHGHHAKIDLREAKKIIAEREKLT